MRSFKFDQTETTKRLHEVLGDDLLQFVTSRSIEELKPIIIKILSLSLSLPSTSGNSWDKYRDLIKNFQPNESNSRVFWDVKNEIEDQLLSNTVDIDVRQQALIWHALVQIADTAYTKYSQIEAILGAILILGQIVGPDELISVLKDFKTETDNLNQGLRDKVGFLEEMTGNNLLEAYHFEIINNVKCFYPKDDTHKFNPELALFPPLTEEDVAKLKNNLPLGLPTQYEKFLKNFNGLKIGWNYFWWGARRLYNEVKHLEQNYSLINSHVDEQLLSLVTSTEIVFASDKYHNVYVMDIASNEIHGIIRPDGDELAQPVRQKFESLGQLLKWQLEEFNKNKDLY